METMTFEQALEWGKSLDGRAVWNALMETRANIERLSAEAEVRSAKTDEQIQKMSEHIDQMSTRVDKVSKDLGGIGNSMGQVTEEMFAAKICDIFHNQYDYEFTKTNRDVKFTKDGKDLVEVDIFLENGSIVMAIEVKTNLTKVHVDDHIERLNKIRSYMDYHDDKKILLGGIAGAHVPNDVRNYAEENGLYVLVQSGENVKVIEEPEKFSPKEW
ncbi:MAG: hypothetical protein LBM77_09430 [Spirochaetaceae bacterium]|jgi:hypothetical protein|nr:hypothetical protein [Spirochaetaceae bacterium]